MTDRDMSAQQFRAALARYGMKEQGIMGYVDINVPGHCIHVSKLNAGRRRRAQLAYLINARDKAMQECIRCGRIYEDHFKMGKDATGRTAILRPCPNNPEQEFSR